MQRLKLTKKYETYSEYKDSGVEWLGKIPKEWGTISSKRIFFEIVKKGEINLPLASVTQEQGVVLRSESGLSVWNPESDISGYKTVDIGDFVISLRSFEGGIEYSEVKGLVSPAYTVLREKREFNKKYYKWLFKSDAFISSLQINVRGIRDGKNISYQDFSRIDLPVVTDINEQEKIAKFLDEKISSIDQIIEKKQKLIEFLWEMRTAVINDAVTKGLNKNTEFVNSGIEWIDEIPKEWKVKKLKFLGEAIIGLTYSPEEVVSEGDGTLVLRSSNVQSDKITLSDNVFVNKSVPKKLITKVGDILICSRNGSRALIGKNAVIDDASAGVSFGAFMTVFRTKNSRFISYFLKSNLFMSQLSTTLTSTINQLTTHYLNNITAIMPPEKDQEAIADYLDKKVSGYDKAIKSAEDSVEKLKEFKSSLISNVVTGKIKV